MKDLLRSKKFRVALLALVGGIAVKLGMPETTVEELIALVSPLLAYIVGQGIADVGKPAANEGVGPLVLHAPEKDADD